MTGQSIQLYGWQSWSTEGGIVGYYWSFGDGTWGSGPNPSHQYTADGAYSVSLTVCDENWNCASSESSVTVDSVNLPVKLNFDELPNGVIVADQYYNQYGVRFSSPNVFYPVHTQQNCGYCSTTSQPNFITTAPNITGQTVVDFTQPVNNLTFYIVRIDAFFNPFAIVDVYRDGILYRSYTIYGNGTGTVGFTTGTVDHISKIVIRNIVDVAGIGFDDFTFSVPSDIKITSQRVSGYLNGTTQKALVGADIVLNSSPVPSGFSGGTYSWSFTGPYQVVAGSANSSSVTIRSTDTSTITANLTYTRNGQTTTASMNINPILPTLTSFSGTEAVDGVVRNACGGDDPPPPTTGYILGCPNAQHGMFTSATVTIPQAQYLSDPAQSGIKSVQIVSSLRKEFQGSGSIKCQTARSQESNVQTGWQVDTFDPSNTLPIRRFSEGNTLSMPDVDSPRHALEVVSLYTNLEGLYIDELFETYVFYFVGNFSYAPTYQKALGFQNSGNSVARIAWSWGGTVVYDPAAPGGYRIISSSTVPGTYPAQAAASVRPYSGNVRDLQFARCPSGPDFATNLIDGARFFIRQQYCDIYSREPDQGGWDYWTGEITKCGFDMDCRNSIHGRRAAVAASFFFEAEAQRVDPDLANPPGSPNFNPAVYNPAFVRHSYTAFLRRRPEPEGLAFWVDNLNHVGDYLGVIQAFTTSAEYRNRNFRTDVCVTPIQ